jgi:hypothetical protein
MSITDGTILRVVVTLLWTDGNIIQNIYNAVVTGGGSPWDNADIVEDAISWAEDLYFNLTAFVATTIDGSQVQVYEYDHIDDDWDEVGSGPFFWNPTGNSDELPRGVAALVNLKTTDPDTSGKKYVGGMVEGDLEDGLWSAATLAAILSYAVDWYAGFAGTDSGATWSPGVWSVVGTVFKLALPQVIIPAIPAYQRRRKRGVGV